MKSPQTTYVRALLLGARAAIFLVLAAALVPVSVADGTRIPSPVLAALPIAPVSAHTQPDPADVVATALGRCGSRLSEAEQQLIADSIVRTAGRHGYDPLFVQAIVEVESTCRPTARSHAGALGLIQVKPATARAVAARLGMDWTGPQQLMSPVVNLELGVFYLAELEKRFADPYLAVAAYNMGPTRVAAMEPSRARGSRYVRKVMSRYEGLLEEHLATPS